MPKTTCINQTESINLKTLKISQSNSYLLNAILDMLVVPVMVN